MKSLTPIKIGIPRETLINAIKQMEKKERESLIEDLVALMSHNYVYSVREARADYKAGKVKTHREIFGKKR